jgi:hypothetical protein
LWHTLGLLPKLHPHPLLLLLLELLRQVPALRVSLVLPLLLLLLLLVGDLLSTFAA